MAPILIDKRSLIKLSLVLLTGMFTLFFSGYFIGFYKAEAFILAGVQTQALNLPDAVVAELDETAYIPDTIEPGLDRDVDAPDEQDTAAETESVTEKAIQATVAAAPVTVAPSADDERQPRPLAIGGPPAEEDDRLALLADTAEAELANYTIQVGLFSNSDNAERKVEDLLAQRLSAYSTEYTGKQDRLMYNVRFGYYDSYRSASTALKIYQTELSGDGYIVRLKK